MTTKRELDQLDDEVLAVLQEQAKLFNQSLEEAYEAAVRRGAKLVGRAERAPFRVKPFSGTFRPGVDQIKFNQYQAGALDDEHLNRGVE